ncbi:unnamed protein product [Thelazia callipaeda]|uniref:SEA domain-containing protein n=1 Tax=Thelazia callipaeda TaxID=103827 RepID=A0A0N5DAK5_THECL|nr:unnamed protein product [Thelazia callipaeda]
MLGLAGKFQRRRDSELMQETCLASNPKISSSRLQNETDRRYTSRSEPRTNQVISKPDVFSGHQSITFGPLNSEHNFIKKPFSVLIIKFPSSKDSNEYTKYPFVTFSPLSDYFTLQSIPTHFPNWSPLTRPALATRSKPIGQLRGRTFLCQMYILNQANQVYANHQQYEYHQATQMILNAVKSFFAYIYKQLKQSNLQPYLDHVQVWNLRDSGSDLLVEFSIILLVPSHVEIDVTTVKNVLLSILPNLEEELNGTQIDPDTISVNYLNFQG